MVRDSLTDTVLNKKYKLGRLIGAGRMGLVYEASHVHTDRRFAVKFLHFGFLVGEPIFPRFQEEVKSVSALRHENIVAIVDSGRSPDDMPFLVMEYLDGQNLGSLLDAEGLLSPRRAASIMVQALSALMVAHGVGIIHQNLKPQNIFLIDRPGKPDHVKLLDFGISNFGAINDESAEHGAPTVSTVDASSYMSPEQARGDRDLSPSSDVYSMGVILSRMVTGSLPNDKPDYQSFLNELQTIAPPSPLQISPNLPPELVDIIGAATAPKKEERFSNCLAFRTRLMPLAGKEETEITYESNPNTRETIPESSLIVPVEFEPEVLTEVRNIGFANSFERGEHSLHIQTEIITARGMKIKTTILDKGVVLDVIVTKNTHFEKDDIVGQIEEAAKLQHETAVNGAMEGSYD